MGWVETLFHVDPDGGSGLFEIAITVFGSLAIAVAAVRLSMTRRRARARGSRGQQEIR
jgi:hypothetical protein